MLTAKVYVLYTGGTFGMTPDPRTPGHPLIPTSFESILPKLKEIGDPLQGAEIAVTFDGLPDGRRIDSASMTPQDWVIIARCIYERYDQFDGFVIIQGTDTLAYTASALSFMFENLGKPVVVTGSQVPLENAHTDAKSNYVHAVMIAGCKASGLPQIPEVVVVFGDRVLRGCRARKVSTTASAGFDSPNAPALGAIGDHIRIFESLLRPPPAHGAPFNVHTELMTRVFDLSLHPGMDPEHLRTILNLQNVEAVVFRTYGTGNAPDAAKFLEALRDGIARGRRTVLNVTQCAEGAVEMGLYASSVGLSDAGVLSGLDMTPEAALTKMMVLFGAHEAGRARALMQIDQRGEQSQSIFEIDFGGRAGWSGEPYTRIESLDPEFDGRGLSAAVLRISDLELAPRPGRTGAPSLSLRVQQPASDAEAGLVAAIDVDGWRTGRPASIVHQLPVAGMKQVLGEKSLRLTVVPADGAEFRFGKLRLCLYMRSQ